MTLYSPALPQSEGQGDRLYAYCAQPSLFTLDPAAAAMFGSREACEAAHPHHEPVANDWPTHPESLCSPT